jgi:hypothetical protein
MFACDMVSAFIGHLPIHFLSGGIVSYRETYAN